MVQIDSPLLHGDEMGGSKEEERKEKKRRESRDRREKLCYNVKETENKKRQAGSNGGIMMQPVKH